MKDEDTDKFFTESVKNVKKIKNTNRIKREVPQIDKSLFKNTKQTKEKNQTAEIKTKVEKFIPNIETNNTNKKLKKGKIPIDKKVDFHGHSTQEAKEIFFETIERCYFEKKRCILFVTGKGAHKTEEKAPQKLFYGKIRNEFQQWIKTERAKIKILNTQQANYKNGGDGAFFVYLRKNKN